MTVDHPDWTVHTLYAHLIELRKDDQTAIAAALAAQEKAVAAALAAADRAVVKAETAADKRFDAVNEFRGQLADQSNTLMPRAEAAVELANLREKIDMLENWRSKATGAGLVLVLFAGVIGGAIVKAFGG